MNQYLETLTQNGTSGFGGVIIKLINEVMRYERTQHLQAQPYERSETRNGHANGFKDKTLRTTMGPLTFAIPQVRRSRGILPNSVAKGLTQ